MYGRPQLFGEVTYRQVGVSSGLLPLRHSCLRFGGNEVGRPLQNRNFAPGRGPIFVQNIREASHKLYILTVTSEKPEF